MPAWIAHDGVVSLDAEWSAVERELLEWTTELLLGRGFTYLSVPSTVTQETYDRQGLDVVGQTIGESGGRLAGSAEQGLLARFAGQWMEPARYVASNQCFRLEPTYEGLLHVREFRKVEQYALCHEEDVDARFEELLTNGQDVLEHLGLDWRARDVSDEPGDHERKVDLEVRTEAYGWMETHSCTSFGRRQSARFGISGADHTLSNTGVASPRILIPLMEDAGIDVTTPTSAD